MFEDFPELISLLLYLISVAIIIIYVIIRKVDADEQNSVYNRTSKTKDTPNKEHNIIMDKL